MYFLADLGGATRVRAEPLKYPLETDRHRLAAERIGPMKQPGPS